MIDWDFDYVDIEEGEWPSSYSRDVKIDEARTAVKESFNENNDRVFYMKQLEVLFEKQFFHWITGKAINELIAEGTLRAEEVPLLKETKVKFVFNRSHRYYKREIRKCVEVVRQYSTPEIAIACGRQAEVLFFNALVAEGFLAKGQNVNEYQSKKWEKTEHDLDFILERDGRSYGCEVKNTWSYIDEEELRIKLEMCDYLGLKPLFIMRGSPKSYNYEIVKKGGYAMIYEAQIYPFGQTALVKRIRNVLGLTVDCPRAIPEGIIKRFIGWHEKGVRRR